VAFLSPLLVYVNCELKHFFSQYKATQVFFFFFFTKKGIAKRLLLKIIGKGNYDSYDIDLKLIVQLNRNVCILANDFALFSVIVTW